MAFAMVHARSSNTSCRSRTMRSYGKGRCWARCPATRWQVLANLRRAYLAYMWAHPGKQLIFGARILGAGVGMGNEGRGLDWWLGPP